MFFSKTDSENEYCSYYLMNDLKLNTQTVQIKHSVKLSK